MLAPAERRALLDLARRTVQAAAAGRPATEVPLPDAAASSALAAKVGAFVSLHAGSDLRGCIGTFDATRPLAETVRDMAAAAALRDPRFAPVTPDEVAGLTVEISVLTPRRRIFDPGEIEIGRHGLEVTEGEGGRRGVLLPQVATEHQMSTEAFLAATCRKAGLSPDAWRHPTTIVEVFEAEVFSEIDALGPRS